MNSYTIRPLPPLHPCPRLGKIRKRPVQKEEIMQGYCVKCRARQEISNASQVTLKNGRPATKGTCPKCGTGMFRIGKG